MLNEIGYHSSKTIKQNFLTPTVSVSPNAALLSIRAGMMGASLRTIVQAGYPFFGAYSMRGIGLKIWDFYLLLGACWLL